MRDNGRLIERKRVKPQMKAGSYSINVDPTPFYLADQSDPLRDVYVFAYHIRITNRGAVPVQLISRHWIITDADGKVNEVRGEGVVGKQPKLAPGESFEYTSGSQFTTPVGTMHGSYHFVAEDGVAFDAPIPKFVLSANRVLH
jgi:ApaG protein